LQGQNERISNFRDENSNYLYLHGGKTYLNLFKIIYLFRLNNSIKTKFLTHPSTYIELQLDYT